jgi:hypothetical protein
VTNTYQFVCSPTRLKDLLEQVLTLDHSYLTTQTSCSNSSQHLTATLAPTRFTAATATATGVIGFNRISLLTNVVAARYWIHCHPRGCYGATAFFR